jgi:quercetin 2,3-dioxygenase
MSGPVTDGDAPVVVEDSPSPHEVHESKIATVGGMSVARTLPRRGRRTIGAWCFADHFGPVEVTTATMQVGPHPHIGLHTATWLLSGEVVHRDSLGSEQPIRPGELNLMTAGRGVAHAEETPAARVGTLDGIQLWIAQPDGTRGGDAAFAHHTELPRATHGDADVTVFVGEIDGLRSPASVDVDIVGAEVSFRGGGAAEVPLSPAAEHGVLTLGADIAINGEAAPRDALVYLPPGPSSVELVARDGTGTVLLLGGQPFEETLLMWWNFVGRTREEIERAYRDWRDATGRFGDVASSLARIAAPPPNWIPM